LLPRLALVAAALILSGTIGTAAQAPAAVPAAPTQPSALADALFQYGGQSYRFDASTRALQPLESIKSKKQRGSKEYCYIEGDTSPVVLRSDDTLAFVSLVHGSQKDIDRYATLGVVAPVMKLFKLERLFASNENRRYATGQYVPMNGLAYGDPIPNINPKRLKDLGQLYISRPAAMPPGEYALTVGGMFVIGTCGGPVSAFRIAP
jgi:hypothetical protein